MPDPSADQLDLFGSPARASVAPTRGRTAIAPAPVAPDVAALGAALPAPVHLGTSSWSFPGWAGIVYDRAASDTLLAREGLAAYARHPVLRAVGIDRTFYSPLPAEEFRRYADQVPAHFRFVVKAPGAVTDAFLREAGGRPQAPNPHFLDAALAASQFVAPAVEGLGQKLGALVFQFPPLGREALRDGDATIARLHAFFAALPRGPLYALELRDPQLVLPDLAAALRDASARYCIGVHARMPSVADQAGAMAALGPGPLVARWNLHSGFAYEEAKAHYAPFDRLVDEDPATRSGLADLAAHAIGGGQSVFVTANNKAEGSAPLTILKLAAAIVAATRGAR
jgi:uncharacterized protein YecE (DUF72 family)